MFLHPIGSSFWMPIASSIAAGLIGYLIGYFTGTITGAAMPEWSGFVLGSLAAGFIWLVDHFYWLAILHDSYKPQQVVREHEEEVIEEPGKLMVRSADGSEIRYIDPPVNDFLMYRFAQGTLNGKAPTYPNWVGEDNPFKAPQFAALRTWLTDRNYARNAANGMIEITEEGQQLFALIISGKVYPTAATGYVD